MPFARTAVFGTFHFRFPAFLVDLPEDRITSLKQNMLLSQDINPPLVLASYLLFLLGQPVLIAILFERQLMLLTQQ